MNEDNMKLKIAVEALDPVSQSSLEFWILLGEAFIRFQSSLQGVESAAPSSDHWNDYALRHRAPISASGIASAS